jgi:hypothetical protein
LNNSDSPHPGGYIGPDFEPLKYIGLCKIGQRMREDYLGTVRKGNSKEIELCAVQLVVQKSWKTASLTEVTWKWEQTAC